MTQTTFEAHKAAQKAADYFAEKGFFSEFNGLAKAARIASPLLSGLSVVTGFGYLFFNLMPAIGHYFGTIAALLLLLVVEVAKRWLGELSFKRSYKYSGGVGLLIATGGFVALSVYMSVTGAELLAIKLDDRAAAVAARNAASLDSLNAHYATLADNVKAEQAHYINSVSWRGKVDVSNKATQATINATAQRLSNIEAERLKNVEILTNFNEKALSTANATAQRTVISVIYISAITEVLILLCVWFGVYFQHRLLHEAEKAAFERGGGGVHTISIAPDNDGLNKGLLDDLQKGVSQFNILAAKHRVNAAQIKRHKAVLGL